MDDVWRGNYSAKEDFIVIEAIQEAKDEIILYEDMIDHQFMNCWFEYMNGGFEYMNGSMADLDSPI